MAGGTVGWLAPLATRHRESVPDRGDNLLRRRYRVAGEYGADCAAGIDDFDHVVVRDVVVDMGPLSHRIRCSGLRKEPAGRLLFSGDALLFRDLDLLVEDVVAVGDHVPYCRGRTGQEVP